MTGLSGNPSLGMKIRSSTDKSVELTTLEVTCILNAVPGGANKDWKQWRKAWTDIKKNVKNRISMEKKYIQGTGGGPPLPPQPDIEKTTVEKIFEIITPVAIEGNKDVPESEIIFEMDNSEIGEASMVVNVGWPEQTNQGNEFDDHIEFQEVDAIQDPTVDHNYNLPSYPGTSGTSKKVQIKERVQKRYSKSARLTDSIKNNKKFLEISQKGIVSTDTYRESKLQLIKKHYETKAIYYQKKIEAFQTKEKYYERIINILTEVSNSVNTIADTLN